MKIYLDQEEKVFATHDDNQLISPSNYPNCTLVYVPDSTKIDYENRTYDTSNCTQDEWDAVNEPPSIVTMRQARLALLQSDLLSSVESVINAIEDPTDRQSVQIEWEYAQEIDRNHQWVQTLIGQLGLTDEQVDNLFVLAASL